MERSKAAHDFSEQVNDRLFKVRQNRDSTEVEKFNSFIMRKTAKEKEISKKKKSKREEFEMEQDKKREKRNVI